MLLPFNRELGVYEQSEGFTRYAPWDFDATPPEKYPLLLNYPYFDLYRLQVVKQADLVLAMYLCPSAFEPEQKLRAFTYYEALTVRDSSLSASVQSVLAAEVGHLALAYDYFAEAALTDLHDLHHNVGAGLHVAALAGAWLCCVGGFGGFRDHTDHPCFAPRLPEPLDRLAFRLQWRASRIAVDITARTTTYRLLAGPPLPLAHHGDIHKLTDTPLTLPNPAPPTVPDIIQPRGRAPRPRA